MSKITAADLKIMQVAFNKAQYFQVKYPKTQIYLHHTAGNSDAVNVFKGWESNTTQVGTCVSISGKGAKSGDGTIVQGFPSSEWAYHLGLKQDVFTENKVKYQSLDKISIGIEICSFGQLTKGADGKFRTYVNSIIAPEDVIELATPYKGYKYYHNYSDAQIESVRKLLLFWNEAYSIPLDYNEDVWGITTRALSGGKGVFTHNSVRKDKVDIYPHPKLIAMWKSLTA